jgi:GT2 family glycosyltransferase
MATAERAGVSVIVVTWNSSEQIAECLGSVVSSLADGDELVVVDNGSSDATSTIVSQQFPQARLIETRHNLGFAAAANVGLGATQADLVMLVNPDARLLPGALDLLRLTMDDPRVGVCGPRIVRSDGVLDRYCARRLPSACKAFCRLTGINRMLPLRALQEPLAPQLGDASVDVPCLTGAALLVRRSLLDRASGLDTAMPMYLEDLELCDRAHQSGLTCRYVGSAGVEHAGARSAVLSPNRALLVAMEDGQAPWLFLRRTRGRWAGARYRAAVLAGSSVRWVMSWAVRPFTSGTKRARVVSMGERARLLLDWSTTRPQEFAARIADVFDAPTSIEVRL